MYSIWFNNSFVISLDFLVTYHILRKIEKKTEFLKLFMSFLLDFKNKIKNFDVQNKK